MSRLAGDTGHAGHVSTVAELAVAATLDDLPVPGNDDVVHLVEGVQVVGDERRRAPAVACRRSLVRVRRLFRASTAQ